MRGTLSPLLIDRQGLVRMHAFGPIDDLPIGRSGARAGAGQRHALAKFRGVNSAITRSA
jgi:hypothetical protein